MIYDLQILKDDREIGQYWFFTPISVGDRIVMPDHNPDFRVIEIIHYPDYPTETAGTPSKLVVAPIPAGKDGAK